MANKTLATIISLKDQFTAPAKKIANSTKGINREVQKTANQIKKMSDSAKTHMGNFAKYTSMAGIALVTAFAKKSVDAAKETIEASTKLSAVLKNVKGVTDSQVESIKNYAGALQELGVVDGDVTISGMQQLGTYQLQAATLKTLMPGMNDLLAQQKGLNATSTDAVSIGNLMGKVMSGQVGALKKVGISFDKAQEKVLKHGTESEKAAMLAKVLQMNVGGVNKALAETDQGKIQQSTIAIGDMQEEVGKSLLPILGTFAKWFQSKIPTIQKFIFDLMDSFKNLAAKVSPYMGKIKDYISSVVDNIKVLIDFSGKMASFIISNWSTIAPIILTVVTAMTAYKTIMIASLVWAKALAVYKKIELAYTTAQTAATGGLTFAQWALNAAMKANPIGLVITAITALIAIGILLYKNWDNIKNIAFSFWESLKNVWASINSNPFAKLAIDILALMNPITAIIRHFDKLKEGWNWIKGKVGVGKTTDSTTSTKSLGGMKEYAKGGIANEPSIFGEAGPEIAIPLNNSTRSKDLLSQANGIINGGNSAGSLNDVNKNLNKNSISTPINQNNTKSNTVITNQTVTNNKNSEKAATPIQIILKGDIYGFDDFKEKVAKAMYEVINVTGSNMAVVE